MKAKLYITFLFYWVYTICSYAQIIPPAVDSIPETPSVIEIPVKADTSFNFKKDTAAFSNPIPKQAIPISVNIDDVKVSEDALDEKIDYDSKDSMQFDVANETVYLYGDAVVIYNTVTVKADYIVFNMKDNIVLAEGMIDSTGHLGGFPVFEEKDQKFDAKKIRYNFKTNKGIIYNAVTTQQDLYIRSDKGGFFGEDAKANRKTDVVYSEDAIFTTCSHSEPHFGIRSKKQKVIPNKVVVVGPSNIEVGGIPTPLWLPFAFFPLKQGPRTGLIFPKNYEYSDAWGFGFNEIGWYFPMGEYMDLTLTGMIYTRGTWGLTAKARYKRRYKYSGNLTLGFSDRKTEQKAQQLSNKSYSIRWSHNQDSKAHPTKRFNGSVNIQTNNFQSLNQNDAESVFQNTLTSNLSYNQSFPGTPYSLSMSMNHSQNTLSHRMDITLPSINFNMNRIYPFKRKNTLDNKEKWFEKISFQYKGAAQNRLTTTDTTLFSKQTLDDAQFGIKHTASTNASFRVLKFFNITPSIDYKEIWYFDKTRKELLDTYNIDTTFVPENPGDTMNFKMVLDTTQYGEIAKYQDFGWNPLRLFNAGISLGTQIFGVRKFAKGKIRGIRHIIKPSAGFNYRPDYTSEGFGYFDYVDSDLRPEENDPIRYSLFESGIYDDAPTSGRQMALSYKIDNIFEAKYWSAKDSSAKNFKLFDNIATNGNYNFAADSLNWSTIRITGTTRFFKGLTTLNLSSELDPYALDEDGRRINTFYRSTGGGLLRYVKTDIRVNTRITIKKLVELISGKPKQPTPSPVRKDGDIPSNFQPAAKVDGFLDLFSNWSISHNLVMQSTSDTFLIRTNSIQTGGSVQLSPKWSMRFGNISYDFKLKRLVYPTLGFYRDLHCWQMGMDWYPERNTFSFFLKVKPGSLDFIKVPYGRNNAESSFGGF